MSPTGSRTSKMNSRLSRLLDEWAELDGTGVSFDSRGGFCLPDTAVRAPDASWVEQSRWDVLVEREQVCFAPLCPDFAIELRSPSDKLTVAQTKMEMWISNGVQVAWLIDPVVRAVSIYRPGCAVEVLDNPRSVQGTGLVSGFELLLSRLWG